MCPDHGEVHRWLLDLNGPLRVVFEAGPTGFGLSRFLMGVRIDCVVAAPSKLVKASGDRLKTDARDALHLARLLRLGEVTAVTVPSIEQEAARDLVRALRGCSRGSDARPAPGVQTAAVPWHRLLRRAALTGKHQMWLRTHRFDAPGLQVAYDSAVEAMPLTTDRRDRLDAPIVEMAADSEFTAVTDRVCCLRGISTLTGFGLVVEVGDWHRFTGSTIGAYLGLVPTESSSGASRSQGSITKTGNTHARRMLVEAAWQHQRDYRTPGVTMRARWDRPRPRRGSAGIRATSACTPVGRCSGPARSALWLPTSRWPANWPAGAGPRPPSNS